MASTSSPSTPMMWRNRWPYTGLAPRHSSMASRSISSIPWDMPMAAHIERSRM